MARVRLRDRHAWHGLGAGSLRSATSGSAVIQSQYDTTELSTRTGEVVEVLAEDVISGWHWCRARDGSEGWIPIKTLEAIKSPIRDRRA